MEQRYSAYERELAAVAYCLQSWQHYLEGCPGDSGDRSSATCPHHGPASADSGSNVMVEIGTLSINPPHHQVPT